MGCCGSRTFPAGAPLPAGQSIAAARMPAEPVRYSHAFFEYFGATALTVIGGATGRRYRFERPGARLAIDPRDRAGLAQVPHVREVYSP